MSPAEARNPRVDPKPGDHVERGSYVRVVYSVDVVGDDGIVMFWQYVPPLTAAAKRRPHRLHTRYLSEWRREAGLKPGPRAVAR